MMYVFSNCRAFIRTVPLLVYDEHKVEDLNTSGEDHCADEVRYFCMSRPIKPRAKEHPDEYASNGYKLFLDVDKKDLRKPQSIPRSVIHE